MFTYHQNGRLVSGEYEGGTVVLGRLVGTRSSDTVNFRYVHLAQDGTSSAGHCDARSELLPDGRIRGVESWRWESRPGSDHSTLQERPPG